MILIKRRTAFWLALSGSLFLTGCFNGSSGSSDPASDPDQPSSQLPDSQVPEDNSEISKEITATIQDLENRGELPILDTSDSLEGPDTDFNGVRDDIQNWLDNQTLSPNFRENFQELAKGYQRIMVTTDLSSSVTHEIAKDMAPIAACLSLTADNRERTDELLAKLAAYTGNTFQRLQHFWDYQDTLADVSVPVVSRSNCSQVLSNTTSVASLDSLRERAASYSSAGQCGTPAEKKLGVGFFNGVGNSYIDAYTGITYVSEVLELSGELANSPIDSIAFRPFYNPSQSAFGVPGLVDLVEVFYQRIQESAGENAETAKAIFQRRVDILALILRSKTLSAKKDLEKILPEDQAENIQKAALQALNEIAVLNDLEGNAQQVYQQHRSIIDEWAGEGRKMFYIAHSQGNLYANQALRDAVGELSVERKDLKLLHVAPASQTMEGGRYVLNNLDVIIRPLLNTPEPTVENNLADQLTIDASGHKFRETYLSEFPSGLQTIRFIVEMFLEMEELIVSETGSDDNQAGVSNLFTTTFTWTGDGSPGFEVTERYFDYTSGEGKNTVLNRENRDGLLGRITEIGPNKIVYESGCGILPGSQNPYAEVGQNTGYSLWSIIVDAMPDGENYEFEKHKDSLTVTTRAYDGTVVDFFEDDDAIFLGNSATVAQVTTTFEKLNGNQVEATIDGAETSPENAPKLTIDYQF